MKIIYVIGNTVKLFFPDTYRDRDYEDFVNNPTIKGLDAVHFALYKLYGREGKQYCVVSSDHRVEKICEEFGFVTTSQPNALFGDIKNNRQVFLAGNKLLAQELISF